nr:venom polypeptide precursor [Doratifera vulnerans]
MRNKLTLLLLIFYQLTAGSPNRESILGGGAGNQSDIFNFLHNH